MNLGAKGLVAEAKGKTPHGEMTIDQLAGIQPGLAKLMRDVSERYTAAYHAAKGGNWDLARYQLKQLRGAFRTAKVTRPKHAKDLDEFDAAHVAPLMKAAEGKDWRAFEDAFWLGVESSDAYHEKLGYGYIRYQLPAAPPSDLYLGKPEDFDPKKRKSIT